MVSFVLVNKGGDKIERHFVTYDIQKDRFSSLGLLTKNKNQSNMFQDVDGFDSFTFCQTSNYVQDRENPQKHRIKYSVFAFFKKELGVIKVYDIIT